jgi:hypothetical protein
MAVEPTLTVGLETPSEVEVDACPTTTVTLWLVDPPRPDPAWGEKTAVRCPGDADDENAVEHVTFTLWLTVATPTLEQPVIAVPPFSNATDPEGGAAAELDVIVAIKLDVWFVIGLAGDTRRAVVVGMAVTLPVAAELAGPPGP